MSEEISLSAPDLTDRERRAVSEVLNGHRLSLGPKLTAFEDQFAGFAETEHAVAVSSGTAALHVLLLALLQREPGGDGETAEVITTPFSFVSSTTTILHAGARPVFVDVHPETLNLDPSGLQEAVTEQTAGILPVHIFGTPADMDPINDVAEEHNLFVVEDACEAIGATYKGSRVGTLSDAGTFAFYPNKQMTTGEGGMVVTDREDLAQACRSLRNQGRNPESDWLRHDRAGFNYRMNEMQAALGVTQLERIDELLARRKSVAEMYSQKLRHLEQVSLLPESEDRTRSWFVFVVLLDPDLPREQIRDHMAESGIETGVYFPCIHKQPFYQSRFGHEEHRFPVAEDAARRTLALPFHNHLDEEQVNKVVETLKAGIQQV